MADGTSVVSDRWGTSAGPRALRERSQYASRLRLPAAAEDRRNCSQVSPRAGRLPSGRGPNADRPFDEPATSTARRVAAATWMMSSRVRLFFVGGPISLFGGGEAGGNWIRQGVVRSGGGSGGRRYFCRQRPMGDFRWSSRAS